ncbi:MAG: hypothetical protein ACR2MT_04370 [Aurantibacter sp.]
MKVSFKLCILLIIPLLINCLDNAGDGNCNGVACTEIFSYLTVKVVDSQSQPVALDSYKVVLTANGSDITPDFIDNDILSGEPGTYIVFSDNYADEYQNKTTVIRFTGFIDTEEVVSSEFTVGADCCHVMMITDNTTITIN